MVLSLATVYLLNCTFKYRLHFLCQKYIYKGEELKASPADLCC